ncbi:MCE family protein [Saccharopolyspora sp. HNM0983]|uniref:MCE family protein n=1 Tax=Saccharopolyspora montiporae TaxID=2781240 RepID=A0A929B8Y7_9PSEU|nr:MCE family protein [Saccharopolyspora sp. HNM0983]MBE9375464.1 MCE family protein [Saccharopolyspora sp. HNM0983]
MNRRSRRRYQALGMAFLLAAGLFFAGSIGSYQKVFTSIVPVQLETDRIGNQMRTGADVKARGVVVGEVREVQAKSADGAVLDLALQPDQVERIPSDSSARLVPKTLFGERYVDLEIPEDSSGPALGAGDVIPQDRSESAIEVEKVLDDLMPVLQAVQPQKLSSTLRAVSEAVEGRGEQLGDTLVEMDRYLAELNPSLPKLQSVVSRLDDVARTYDDAAPNITQALEDLSTTSRTVSEQRGQLSTMIDSVTGAAQTSERFLDNNGDNLIQLAGSSRPSLELLAKYAPEYPCMLQQFAAAIPNGEKSFGKGTEHPEIAKFTLEITSSRGKYEPGRDTPQYLDQRGPRCYPWVEPPQTFPQYPPGGPIEDGSVFPDPPKEQDNLPWLTDATGTQNNSPANTPAEQDVISSMMAPEMGVERDDVPGWSGLLVGPMFRGAEVDLK